MQEEAYVSIIEELGDEEGPFAYRLACRSIGVDPAARLQATPSVAPVIAPPTVTAHPAPHQVVARPSADPQTVAAVFAPAPVSAPPVRSLPVEPIEPVPYVAPAIVRTPEVRPQPVSDDPSRLERYGVAIKRSKLAEAEEVIEQARRTAAQNRKSNPYSDDRGRNAWRNTLFAAVLSAEGGQGEDDTAPSHVEAVPAIPVSLPVDPSRSVEVEEEPVSYPDVAETDSFSDVDVFSSVDDEDNGYGDVAAPVSAIAVEPDVLDTAPVTPPARSVPYTRNPAQTPPPKDPAPADVPPFARKVPPFVKTEPPKQDSTPKVHVSAPVQNRTHAHGQAVPAPPGLTEHLKSMQAGQQAAAAGPVTTPKRPPVSTPAFLRNK